MAAPRHRARRAEWCPRPAFPSTLLSTVLLSSIGCARGGNFVTSLQSHFVVNLDFDGTSELTQQPRPEERVIAFAGGKRKFRCTLPTGKNRSQAAPRVEGAGTDSSGADSKAKFEEHFRVAKLLPYKGRCWDFKKDYWSYEICPSKKITQYNTEAGVTNSLGEHMSSGDVSLPDGGIEQSYQSGSGGRKTTLRYICGSYAPKKQVVNVEEVADLSYLVEFSGPQFCGWAEGDGTETISHPNSGSSQMQISSLLEDLRGSCINMTQGWWTYEYCYPHTLKQYHLAGTVRDPEHVMGTMNVTKETQEVDMVNMTIHRLKPSVATRERRTSSTKHRALRQYLGKGAICDETGKARAATMLFQCPSGWQQKAKTTFVSIQESALCEYEILIQTGLLCGHRRLIPTLPRGKEVIQCAAEP